MKHNLTPANVYWLVVLILLQAHELAFKVMSLRKLSDAVNVNRGEKAISNVRNDTLATF